MVIYLSLIGTAIIPAFVFDVNKNELSQKRYLFFVFTLAAAVLALRDVSVGADTENYFRSYNEIGWIDSNLIFTRTTEYGFIVLNKLLSYIGNFQILLITYACFVLCSFARFIYKNSEDVVISSFIFLCFLYPPIFVLIRQYFAIAILLFGIEYLKKKEHLKFALIVLIASLFHSSAIICIIYIFIYKFVTSLKTLPFYIIIIPLVAVFYREILGLFMQMDIFDRYNFYIDSIYDVADKEKRPLRMLMALLILLFFAVTTNRKSKTESSVSNQNFTINMLLTWSVMELIATNMLILLRFAPYFDFITFLALPIALNSIKNKQLRYVCTFVSLLLFFLYFYVTCILQMGSTRIVPYKFWGKG